MKMRRTPGCVILALLFFIFVFQPFAAMARQTVWPRLVKHFELKKQYSQLAVKKEVVWWLLHKPYLNHVLLRSKLYLAYIYQQTQHDSIPAEFALLPAIESNYNPFAYSSTGATGLWQMMPATASSFGLSMDWWYDDRRDTIASTQTALHYLKRLHAALGSWLLTAAAYNAGIGEVESAELKAHSRSFWNLNLPDETQIYVPKLLALAQIVSHAKKYHVHLPSIDAKPPFSSVLLKQQMDIAEISRLSQTTIKTIRRLNPGMRRWATMPRSKKHLLLPRENVAIFLKNMRQVLGRKHIAWNYHQVRKGESLEKITREFHTSSALLSFVNHLSDARKLREGEGVLVPFYAQLAFSSVSSRRLQSSNRQYKQAQKNIENAVNKIYRSVI